MFVFKAAVVGAGTMGGEIAQTIASAGIPVMLKDIERATRRRRAGKAREVTRAQVDRLVERGSSRASRPTRRRPRSLARIIPATVVRGVRRRGLRHRGGTRADGDQAGRLRRARRGHAGSRDPRLEHLVAVDHRARPGHDAARAGARLPLLLPGVGHAADRGHRGRATRPRGDGRGGELRPDAAQDPDPLRRGARLRRQPGPQLRGRRGLARPGGGRTGDPGRRSGDRRGGRRADGAVLPRPTCSGSTPCSTSPSTCATPTAIASTSTGDERAGGRRASSGAKTGRGFYENGEPRSTAVGRVRRAELAERFVLKALVECCLLLEEGVAGIRDIDLGMLAGRRAEPAAVRARRRRRPRRGRSRRSSAPRPSGASASRRRRSSAAWSPRGAWASPTGQGFFPYRAPDAGQDGRVKLETRAERGSRSPGSTTRRPTRSSPAVVAALRGRGRRSRPTRGPCPGRSPRPTGRCSAPGADIKAFAAMDADRPVVRSSTTSTRWCAPGAVVDRDDRRGQRARARRGLRAGDGLRPAHRRRVGELRSAGDQPGHHPRVRGHPAPAAPRRPGQGARDEPDRQADRGRRGL